ncbi:type VII secretion protein EccE [Micromonospora sp. WMMD1120]|uniref:type VII secretion protein EccE n=1 Tax=Micromonospora sp. WMMD1120 TaxID=3016106 RepID=UPI0024170B4F|nr:type VII secretion protein EccE [Micromonospora sp. WMMD1120]MDG4807341.1 type VII secretion protein EccE [Micromonospora sp. WMMD1120]
MTTGEPPPATALGPRVDATAPVTGPARPAGHGLGSAGPRPARRRSLTDLRAWLGREAGVRVRAGQLVTTQVAAALVLATLGRPAPVVTAAALVGALLLAVCWVPVRGRWLYEWTGTAIGHLTRRRALTGPAGAAELLDLVAPGTVVRSTELPGGPAAVLEDTAGLVALLEVGDPGDLLGDAARAIPAPTALLPAAGPDQPPLLVQLLLAGGPAPVPGAAGTVGTSYRQLADGRLAGRERAVVAVRVLRVDGWSEEDLRRVLAGTVRRIVRRLSSLAARPLGEPAALRVLAELAHHEGEPIREFWSTLRSGELLQATFRLVQWPDAGATAGHRLAARLLVLPATATTVSITAGPSSATGASAAPTEMTVRLAAGTTTELATATEALLRLVTDLGGRLRRLDGAHLGGLAGTLPLASITPGAQPHPMDDWELSLGTAGLMVGTNRHGAAVTVRLFRPESTRVLLVGGVRAAQLVALRALAVGALVVVQTARPRVWEPFVRGVGAPGLTIPLLPPGRSVAESVGTALRPLLLVVDAGPVPADAEPGPPWRATMVLRDELTSADVDALSRADLAVLQPLTAAEASLAGTALGLGGSAEWLTRIRDDMVAVVNRRALRWVLLSPTPIESQLVGRPARG